jgi:hypothetical protein
MCEKFIEVLEEGFVIRKSDIEKGDSYFIRSIPEDDIDQTVFWMEITHCPFCGDELRTGKGG